MSKSKREAVEAAAHETAKALIDQGMLLEAGFALFATYVIPKDAPAIQLQEMRLAFMAGADHVFSTVMGVLDPEEEPTDEDMRRMELIHAEIEKWRVVISQRISPVQGNA